jgi:ribosomal protein S18 acetylase RimI-like enzyme
MSTIVRPTVIEDARQLWEIQRLAFQPLYEKYHDVGNPHLRELNDITSRIGMSRYQSFTILEDDVIVGAVIYRCKGSGTFFDDLKSGEYYLQRVFIHPDYQHKGIARAALGVAELFLPNANKIYVDFPADLDVNRKCYEANGFLDTGRREEVYPGLILAAYEKTILETNQEV